ncbi:peroxin 20 [Pyrenophora seminiperda CCB06]|uniref:Peroxin 20 n=1 Tax=Pyrenophora seminiperda CCB06 TaxID=1302712 RepID=A0A3M7M3V1_9PLEO|nr:peroxin 20 [Pyrenophora seminiperda CCB06]
MLPLSLPQEMQLQQFGGPRYAQTQPPPQFAQQQQQHQIPGWAADFQNLNITGPAPQTFQQQQQQQQQQRPQAAESARQQDFLRQQNTYGSMSGYSMGGAFGGQAYMQPPPTFQGVAQVPDMTAAQDEVPAFDEAAFEQAFAQAQQDMMAVAEADQAQAQAQAAPSEATWAAPLSRTGEPSPLLLRLHQTRPGVYIHPVAPPLPPYPPFTSTNPFFPPKTAVYSAIQVWQETGLGHTSEALDYLAAMSSAEQTGSLVTDAHEAAWIVDSLRRVAEQDAATSLVRERALGLVEKINARIMSQWPLGAMALAPLDKDVGAAWQEEISKEGLMLGMVSESFQERQEEEKQEGGKDNVDDEMAQTAAQLLDRVKDNTSDKFANSNFLALMRRLRDREVRVEEDRIVEVGVAPNSNSQQPTTTASGSAGAGVGLGLGLGRVGEQGVEATRIPDIDPMILNHAATDFEHPLYSHDGDGEGLAM